MPATLPSHDQLSLFLLALQLGALSSPDSEEPATPAPKPEPKEKPVPNAAYTEDDYALFCAARKLGDLVFEEFVKLGGTTVSGAYPDPWLGDRRYEGVNPFYSQTAQGLRLERSYSSPNQIHTPWGQWGITGGASYSGDIMERHSAAVLARLSTTVYVAQYYASGPLGGVVGPVYDVTAIDGVPLPPVKSHERGVTSHKSYEDAHAQWAAMTARYHAEHPDRIPHDPYKDKAPAWTAPEDQHVTE